MAFMFVAQCIGRNLTCGHLRSCNSAKQRVRNKQGNNKGTMIKIKNRLAMTMVAGALAWFTLPVLATKGGNAAGSAGATPAIQQALGVHAKSGKAKWEGKAKGKKKGKHGWNSKKTS